MKVKEFEKKLKMEYKNTFKNKKNCKRSFRFRIKFALAIGLCVLVIGLLIQHGYIAVQNKNIEAHNKKIYQMQSQVNLESTDLLAIQSKQEYQKAVETYRPNFLLKKKKKSILSSIFTLKGCTSKKDTADLSPTPPTNPDNPGSFDTNVQTVGIDEADIAKSDGKYIYVLSNDTLTIFNLEGTIVCEKNFKSATELFIYQNKIVLIGEVSFYILSFQNEEIQTINSKQKIKMITSRLKDNIVYFVYFENLKEVDYSACFYDKCSNPAQLCTITKYDLSTNEMKTIQEVVGETVKVYASLNAFYLSSSYSMGTSPVITAVSMFDYELDPKGVMKSYGYVLNQFSMDEYEGYFRIVTTDLTQNAEKLNSISIYDLNQELKRVGYLNQGIGIGRQTVRSVRFDQTNCYVVTYENKDPLYEINCSDPMNPVITSSYQAPGYSNYLHNFTIEDQPYILGLGYTDSRESTKISVFENKDQLNQIGKDYILSKNKYYDNADYESETIRLDMFENHKALFIYNDNHYFYIGTNVSKEEYIIFKIDVFNPGVPVSIYKKEKITTNSSTESTRVFLIEGTLYYTTHENQLIIKEWK